MKSTLVLMAGLLAGACGCSGVRLNAQGGLIAPPLHTEGHRIVDAAGHTVRLASVNWYGFDEKEFVAGGLDHAS